MIHPKWKTLQTMEDLDNAHKTSFHKDVILFKHSTTCGISAGAEYRLHEAWDFDEDQLDLYYLDLLNYRSISNAIASKYNVVHQSPQVIVLRNGDVVANTSHHMISADWLSKHIPTSTT